MNIQPCKTFNGVKKSCISRDFPDVQSDAASHVCDCAGAETVFTAAAHNFDAVLARSSTHTASAAIAVADTFAAVPDATTTGNTVVFNIILVTTDICRVSCFMLILVIFLFRVLRTVFSLFLTKIRI